MPTRLEEKLYLKQALPIEDLSTHKQENYADLSAPHNHAKEEIRQLYF
jgi:hypothetical protein